MVKTLQLKLVLLLCLIMGAGTAWATDVTYTISSKNTLTTTGTAPTGSSATIAETYGTSCQMTSGNEQTLTLKGYNGYKISKLVLSMKSNSKGGSGTLKYSVDGGTNYTFIVGSSSSSPAFNSTSWNGSWSTSYVNITKTVDITCGSADVVFVLHAATNSLYCQSYTVTYEAVNTNQVATPTFSPAAGAVTKGSTVTISSTTEGATIYYTTDGANPTTSSTQGSTVTINAATTIKAIAVKNGMSNSSVATAAYTIANPTVSFGTHDNVTLEMWDEDLNDLSSGDDVAEGTTVYVKATPAFGYILNSISAVDANNNTVTLTENTGNWSFTMPSSNVTINATATADPNIITLWSEDFSSYSADAVPSGGTYGYACSDGSSNGTTKIYAANLADGTSPELLVAKSSGTFTAVVPLNNASGTLTLTYKTNAQSLTVSTPTEGISGGGTFNTKEEHTVTFTGVTTSMTSITIVFTAGSNNVRLDDIVLRGSAQVVAVEAPTFSVNGGTYYTAQSVELSCATDGATIYYTTNGDEPTSSSTEYTGAITVSETMTIKAIAIKGSDQSTVSSSTYTIAEKNDVVFNITDKSLAYGETYTVTKGTYSGPDIQTDGYVTVSTNNAAVASVSGMTITANAVGTATITLSVAEGDTYKAGLTTITLTVTAPEGQMTAPGGNGTLFKETFDGFLKNSSNATTQGGNDNGQDTGNDVWSGNAGATAFATVSSNCDESDWSVTYGGAGYQCAKFGNGNNAGSATTRSITVESGKSYNLTFKAAPWNEESATMNVTVSGGNISGISTDAMTTKQWNNFSATIEATATTMTVTFAASKNRFFLDEVEIIDPNATGPTVSATLNSSGYATYCSVYPLDFTDAESNGYTAWQITNVSSPNNGTCAISFSQITGSIKGGQGVLLKGTAGETVSIPSSDSSTELSGNLLFGTTAPTFATYDNNVSSVYGLKGNTFVKNNVAGVIPANRAYLLANSIPTSAKSFTFIFENDVTGISETMNVTREEAEKIFNLGGQRLNKMQRGINIVNGKKVMIK